MQIRGHSAGREGSRAAGTDGGAAGGGQDPGCAAAGSARLPRREMLVSAACPGVRQPEGSSRRSISLIKNRRPCARLLY